MGGFFIWYNDKKNAGRRVSVGKRKQLSEETRRKLKGQVAYLQAQMQRDNSDLDFETHLHMVKDLERILKEG